MNQILKTNTELETFNDQTSVVEYNKSKIYTSTKVYKFQFIISSIIACCCLIIFFARIYKQNEKEKFSQELMQKYQVTTLYSENSNFSTQLTNNYDNTLIQNASKSPFVIGLIKIDKINLNYPILSQSNKDLLQISLCRFAGPMPNESGNLCIAGHNYVDYRFFSRLNELGKGDKFKIYDLNGKVIEYTVFKKYETNINDLSCTDQNTNGINIVTLLTCNNINGKRLVIVAK